MPRIASWQSSSASSAARRAGRSSVRYEIGLRERGAGELAAEGLFVHVFVDRANRRPTEIPPRLRAALESLSA